MSEVEMELEPTDLPPGTQVGPWRVCELRGRGAYGVVLEYDTISSGRDPGHQARATANDPNAEIMLLIVP